MRDLTELVTAARTNDPRVVGALAERFSSARFYLPLESLDGVSNRPETALDLGASLPIHRLRLDIGLIAIPLFTAVELCRHCAKRLSWKTDGKAVKTLPVPGSIALPHLRELLLDPEINRLIVNPLSDGALHLARTDVSALVEGRPLRTLWLYARSGGLNRPVEIEGSSLLTALWSAAGRAISRPEEARVEEEPQFRMPETKPEGFAAELYKLCYAEVGDGLEVIVTRTSDGVRVESIPALDAARLARARSIAERYMADSPVGTRATLRMDRVSVTLSESISTQPPAAARKEPAPCYIPLEPEEDGD